MARRFTLKRSEVALAALLLSTVCMPNAFAQGPGGPPPGGNGRPPFGGPGGPGTFGPPGAGGPPPGGDVVAQPCDRRLHVGDATSLSLSSLKIILSISETLIWIRLENPTTSPFAAQGLS